MVKRSDSTKMTKMQRLIFNYIDESIRLQGYPPSTREICDAVGLKSPSTAHFHLTNMEEKGFLQRDANKGRAITLNPDYIEDRDEGPVEEPNPLSEPDPLTDRVPVVGNVAAGTPILAQECIEDYITFDTNGRPGEYFALRVRGESMLYAGILPDDLVVVHQQHDAHNGEIVVAMIEDEATVKRLSRKNGQVWLLPENPAYQPIDGRCATILGKVSAVVRTYS